MSDMGSARRAKDALKQTIAAEPWCEGVAVERADGVGFIVRVSVSAGSAALAKSAIGSLAGEVVVKIIERDAR